MIARFHENIARFFKFGDLGEYADSKYQSQFAVRASLGYESSSRSSQINQLGKNLLTISLQFRYQYAGLYIFTDANVSAVYTRCNLTKGEYPCMDGLSCYTWNQICDDVGVCSRDKRDEMGCEY